jgi:hypothetical protein
MIVLQTTDTRRSMAQVNRRFLVAEARVQTKLVHVKFCGGQSGQGAGFPLSTSGATVSIIPTVLHNCVSSTADDI